MSERASPRGDLPFNYSSLCLRLVSILFSFILKASCSELPNSYRLLHTILDRQLTLCLSVKRSLHAYYLRFAVPTISAYKMIQNMSEPYNCPRIVGNSPSICHYRLGYFPRMMYSSHCPIVRLRVPGIRG